ncbi:hypothetical protein P872_13855 [Rhodonellum psychrophilum GCM71 = DSM 17998]|uniref:Uncharacterized protein n=2 Tax=Rhodonellum TaxID=336827 RepID=U5BWL2_9BACT|nr:MULTISPECIES: hypothetical protein [Rhodonellum]ERM80312.1 hypothetical protein P872_13855 [Rhodonellum psychrophilum GCM71 = DSM 17998]SDZ58852.1 hypothetical protein SAMN05444412_1373 [Rhodonellum ikkaensis]
MIDDIKFEIPFDPPLEFRQKITHPFEWNGMVFSPEFNKNGDVTSYTGELKNLYLKMISGKIIVVNSLHKFYHGNNYSEFTEWEIKQCMETLSAVFGDVFWESRITKLTVAINLECDPKRIIERLISFKGNPMEPMRPRNSRTVYGKRYPSTHYNIKIYDKQFEVKKCDRLDIVPTLRIEIEMNMAYFQKRRLNPILIFNPRDLWSQSAAAFLTFELYEVISSLGFDYGLDPEQARDFHDASVIIFMSNPLFKKVLKKKSNYRTYKGYERRLEELRQEFKGEDYNQMLEKLLEKKLKFLNSIPVA